MGNEGSAGRLDVKLLDFGIEERVSLPSGAMGVCKASGLPSPLVRPLAWPLARWVAIWDSLARGLALFSEARLRASRWRSM